MIKLPVSIKVGPFRYKVVSYKAGAQLDAIYGHCDNSELIIRVDTERAEEQIVNTLLHELLHAVYHSWGLSDGLSEEQVVTSLANGLQAVFRDNPKFLEVLNGSHN